MLVSSLVVLILLFYSASCLSGGVCLLPGGLYVLGYFIFWRTRTWLEVFNSTCTRSTRPPEEIFGARGGLMLTV